MSEITLDHSAYERPALGDVKVGDTVFVFRGIRHATDRPITCRIAKIGRVWVDIDSVPEPAYRPWRMRMDTQNENTGYGNGGAHFLTPAQMEWRERRDAAYAFLRKQGITAGSCAQDLWRTDAAKIHLAELLKDAIEREVGER